MKKNKKEGEVTKMSPEDEKKLMAFLSVLLSIIGFIIAYVTKKDDKYVMFYAKQSLILFFVWIIVAIISAVISLVPILGQVISGILMLLVVILWIYELIFSVSGKMVEMPVIGHYADNLKL